MESFKIDSDIIAQIKLLATENGGRKNQLPSGIFKCIFVFQEENFDCGILTGQEQIRPGDQTKISIKFLFPEYLKSRLKIGSKFYLREMNTIGEGEVIEIN